jgi:class 3 adenylate cyclase
LDTFQYRVSGQAPPTTGSAQPDSPATQSADAPAAPATSSFLFLDLVGYTALTDQHGDDHAADAALALYACVRPLLFEHGAEEVKTIGDAMMLRCERPVRAVELGLRIVSCVEAEETLPSVRVGIHSGSAVRRGSDWYGSTVNVAARLCSAAGGCEVLVSDATRALAHRPRGVEFGDRRLHWLKNVTEPVVAWVALDMLAPPAGALGPLRRLRGRLAWRARPLPQPIARLKSLTDQLHSCRRDPALRGTGGALPRGMA